MALLNFSGFEFQTEAEHESGAGTRSIDTSVYRWGSSSLLVNPADGATTGVVQIRKATTTGAFTNISESELFVGKWFRFGGFPSSLNEPTLAFHTGIGHKLEVRINSDGTLSLYDSTGALLGTTSWTASIGQWYFLEASCATGSPAAYTLRIDTVTVLSGTSNLGATVNQQVRLGKWVNRNSKGYTMNLDTHYLATGGFLGPVHATLLIPTGNGTYTAWTGNYTAVDDIPVDDADYCVSTRVADEAESFTVGSLTAKGTILGVKVIGRVLRDAGSNGSVRLRTRHEGANYDTSADFASSSSWTSLFNIFETQPGGALAWTKAAVQALECGIVEKSATAASRLSACAISVLHTGAAPVGGVASNQLGNLGLGLGLRV